jgi:polyisoprenoid-binding protein YceI
MPNTTPHTTHPAAEAAIGRWVLDPAQSSVRFRSKTFWGLSTVKGAFGAVSGEGEVRAGGAARGTLTIQAASLDSGHAKRDTHLRSADFFSAEEHPALVFSARTVAPTGTDGAEVSGDLVIRGTSRPLAFTARITSATERAVTLEADVVIDRADFGMTWNQLGMLTGPSSVEITARFLHQG